MVKTPPIAFLTVHLIWGREETPPHMGWVQTPIRATLKRMLKFLLQKLIIKSKLKIFKSELWWVLQQFLWMWHVAQSVQSSGGCGWSDTLRNGLGMDETYQNMRERRLWMRDTNFLGKNEWAVGVRKTTILD
jgi:hypothetical protein